MITFLAVSMSLLFPQARAQDFFQGGGGLDFFPHFSSMKLILEELTRAH